jgi:hypothetical protein
VNLSAQARSRWAYKMVQRCQTPPPKYGSTEWLRLPENDVRRIAAVVIAAEAWASAGDCLEDTLRAQLDAEREAFKRAEDTDYQQRRDAHRAAWLPDLPGFRHDPELGAQIEAEFQQWVDGGGAS